MKTSDASGEIILCLSTRGQGQALLRELSRLGCRVVLLTVEELRDADWPHDALHQFQTMPGGMTQKQILNTVTYLARSLQFVRILALDASSLQIVAALREHMRIPGMGLTTTRFFNDRLAMRSKAGRAGVRVPAFASLLNDDVLRAYLESVPAPWLLQPRSLLSTTGDRQLEDGEQVWEALTELGDDRSNFLLEQVIPGEMVAVDGITTEGKVVCGAAHTERSPGDPLCGSLNGTLAGAEVCELRSMHSALLPAFGFMRGVTQTRFLRSQASGAWYFLETSVGVEETSTAGFGNGVDPWVEWARVEVAALRHEAYVLSPVQDGHAAEDEIAAADFN